MKFIKRYYWAFLTILFVALDQLTKYLIVQTFKLGEVQVIIPDFFELTHVRNDGAAMGILDGQRWIFMIFTTIIVAVCVIFLIRGKIKNHWGILALTMIISGGIGNMIDRIFLGEVVDFLAFIFWGYRFYVFNVADVFVCCGVFVLAIYILFSKDFDSPKKKENLSDETL